jgi:hypothetical protein
MLAILINRTKNEGHFNGVVPHLVDDGLSILQYANNTVIFLDHDLSSAINLKLLLCSFEQLLGLKINFHKSEIFYFVEAKEVQDEYSSIFGCQCDLKINFHKSEIFLDPFKYLGIPIHHKKLSNMIGK